MTTFDTNYAHNMATQLAGYDVQGSYSRLDRNKKDFQAQQKALTTLSSALSTFQSKLSSLKGVGSGGTASMVQNKATLSSPDYATATVGGTAKAGSYQFHVAQLASKDQLVLGLQAGDLTGSGTLELGQNGAAGFAVDMAGITTLEALAAKINDAADNSGVQASVVRSVSGGVTTDRLVLSSENTGADQAITKVRIGGVDAASTRVSTAKNAVVYLGSPVFNAGVIDDAQSIKLENSSNTFAGIADGLDLTFSKTHKEGDAPLSVDVAQDTSATKAKVQEFVDAYNTLMSTIKTLTAAGGEDAERGPLAADGMTRGIKSLVDNLVRQNVGGESLVSLGITAKRDGGLELNGERFDKMLASRPEVLDTVFKGNGSDKGLLDSLLDTQKGLAVYTSSVNGVLKSRKDSLADSLKRVDQQYERVDTQHQNLYQRYLKQYTAMVQIMSSLEYTSSMYFDLPSAEKKK